MNKILRILVCFILICSLLVNFLPTRAEAISTGVAVSAGIVASAIIYGLGVAIGEYPDEFNSLVSEAISAMETAGVLVTNGLMDVVSLGSGLFGVKSDTIQSLFDWLYSSNVLSYGPVLGTSATYCGKTYYADREVIPFAYRYSTASTVRCYYGLCSYSSFKTQNAYGQWVDVIQKTLNINGKTFYYTGANTTVSEGHSYYDEISSYPMLRYKDSNSLYQPEYNLQYFLDGGSTSSQHDLTLNFVANPGISLAVGYPAWAANSVTIPNAETGEDEVYYPIALGNSMEETQSFTQEQVWAGAGTYVDSESVPGTGDGTITVPDNVTLKDILAGVLSIPHAIATGIEKVVAAVVALPAAIVDGLRNPKPPDDHNNFALADLKNFFPFCIPFDLYAFFQLLNADPVAPVLSWEIQDLAGQTYSLSVDLAEWDSVAQLFRRLQLFLFITGLAAASRKFIKW